MLTNVTVYLSVTNAILPLPSTALEPRIQQLLHHSHIQGVELLTDLRWSRYIANVATRATTTWNLISTISKVVLQKLSLWPSHHSFDLTLNMPLQHLGFLPTKDVQLVDSVQRRGATIAKKDNRQSTFVLKLIAELSWQLTGNVKPDFVSFVKPITIRLVFLWSIFGICLVNPETPASQLYQQSQPDWMPEIFVHLSHSLHWWFNTSVRPLLDTNWRLKKADKITCRILWS